MSYVLERETITNAQLNVIKVIIIPVPDRAISDFTFTVVVTWYM